MINTIKISGLKCISNLEVQCSNLNVITGTNSSGKSSFIQAVLLFFQTYSKTNTSHYTPVGLNGHLVSLGEFRENKNYNMSASQIKITIKFSNSVEEAEVYFDEDEDLECKVSDNCELDVSDFINSFETDEKTFGNIKYLSCNRIGSRDVYDKNYSNENIGSNGEYAIYYLEKNKTNILEEVLIKDHSSETLSAQVNYWLSYIVNATITTENIIGTDIVKASYSVNHNRQSRPKNVGSGISYLISVLVLCLSSEKDDVLIIENPEIHLHPKAQSKVCEFLHFISKSGRQVFVETHSDHIFNGIRAGIAIGDIDKEEVCVNFMELDEKNCTKNTVIEFGKRGRIINYTDGLFDQFDIDLNKMLNL